jgi:hypothetical protein
MKKLSIALVTIPVFVNAIASSEVIKDLCSSKLRFVL